MPFGEPCSTEQAGGSVRQTLKGFTPLPACIIGPNCEWWSKTLTATQAGWCTISVISRNNEHGPSADTVHEELQHVRLLPSPRKEQAADAS